MDNQERLNSLLQRLASQTGLPEDLYVRLSAELDRSEGVPGRDAQGRLKIIMFDARSYDIEAFDRGNHQRFALHYVRVPLNQDTVAAAAGFKVVCIFVNDTCDAPIVERLAALGVELIALRAAGFNNVDLAACAQHGIQVVRVPAYSPHAVAEHTVALMMMLNRRLHQAYVRNRAGSFILDGLIGFDMRGKTIGVIGTGKIGQCVVDILQGFGCEILAYDPHPNPKLADRPGVRYVELGELFHQSHIITLHVPLFPETYHLINPSTIARMREGVMLINTSRGGLIDTKALIDGLKAGKIGSAGLDVYEEEAGIFFNDISGRVLTDDTLARLLTFNNVVITSHQAFLTHEALSNIADTTFSNIEEFAAGRRGQDLTNAVRTN